MKLTLRLLLVVLAIAVGGRAEAATWDAGRDFAMNEQPDGTQELANPNPVAPSWSYGYRATVEGSGLTLFAPADHTNDIFGTNNFDGWQHMDDPPLVGVNAGSGPASFFFGLPFNPGEMVLSPGQDLSVPVVRWTAPAAGTYKISVDWRDIHTIVFDGGSGHVVVNGSSIYNATWTGTPNAAADASTTQTVSLNVGDTVDFVVGGQADYRGDMVAMHAVIVPEPGTWGFALAALLTLGCKVPGYRRARPTAGG
jgi:hypothetical protein